MIAAIHLISLLACLLLALIQSDALRKVSLRKFQPRQQLFGLKKERVFLRMSSDDQSADDGAAGSKTVGKPSTSAQKKRPANVDLFAAEDRKMPSQADTMTVSASAAASPRRTSKEATAAAEKDERSSLADKPKSAMGLQAEQLRLEATVEQLAIDQERIEKQKAVLIATDQMLMRLIIGKTRLKELVTSTKQEEKALVRKEMFFRIIELANSESVEAERMKYLKLYDDLLEVLKENDPQLHNEIISGIAKELKLENSRIQDSLKSDRKSAPSTRDEQYQDIVQRWAQQIGLDKNISAVAGNTSVDLKLWGLEEEAFDDSRNFSVVSTNGTQSVDAATLREMLANGSLGRPTGELLDEAMQQGFPGVMRIPAAAVPSQMVPILLRAPSLSPTNRDLILRNVFDGDVLNVSSIDKSDYITTVRGTPVKSLEETVKEVNKRFKALEETSAGKNARIFALPEYKLDNGAGFPAGFNPFPGRNQPAFITEEKFSGTKYEPIWLIVSSEANPKSPGWGETAFGVLTLIFALISSFIFATDVNSLNAEFVQQALAGDETVVGKVLEIAGGLLGLQLFHDMGHYIMSLRYGSKLSFPPYLLPSLQIGIFGSVTNFLKYPKNRKELFDISIAGPLFGFIASLVCILFGLQATASASPDVLQSFPQLPVAFFQSSLLLGQLADNFLHYSSTGALLLSIHPCVAVGSVGLLANALNFLPIGRLDGGRVATAVTGRRSADTISFLILLGQFVGFFTGSTSTVQVFWTILVVFLQRGQELAPEDDITPVATSEDDEKKGIEWFGRLAALAFCSILAIGLLFPVPMNGAMDAVINSGASPPAGVVPDSSFFQNLPSNTI